MDYAGGCPSLADYAQLHANSLFLSSQMHLFIHFANALRFLSQQNLTHMDLSTNNLLVAKDLLVKVIDFAEAHHPHDCDNNPSTRCFIQTTTPVTLSPSPPLKPTRSLSSSPPKATPSPSGWCCTA